MTKVLERFNQSADLDAFAEPLTVALGWTASILTVAMGASEVCPNLEFLPSFLLPSFLPFFLSCSFVWPSSYF